MDKVTVTDWASIQQHYDLGQEDSRLQDPYNLERLRTLDIFRRFMKSPPAVVYDIGGATGVYAFPLSEKGYQVHLIEPVESQLQFVRSQNQQAKFPIHSIENGNALSLKKETESADVALLMGPLYHLISFEDRLRAIKECYRVLKPGGMIFSAAVSRYASLMDMFADSTFHEEPVRNMVIQDLRNGQHRCPPGRDLFTTAFFHLPEELKSEHESVGFKDVRILGVEGPIWKVPDLAMEKPGAVETRLEVLRGIEEDSHIISASAHFLAIGRK